MSSDVYAVKFKQWLKIWDSYEYSKLEQRTKPEAHAYLFSMPAVQLRALSGVYRRIRDDEDGEGEGVQRRHDPKRSAKIRDFVLHGYPYGELQARARTQEQEHLKKPGWLPTAVVVNILTPGTDRRGRRVARKDLISIEPAPKLGADNVVRLKLPYEDPHEHWVPTDLEPMEVIDGQHRLWAFEEALQDGSLPKDFELPVVAFRGLDLGWQAYLFWSINVSPKKINPSHAFDLFPLLRTAGWLETLSDLRIYREARAQELTELLYQHPESPWYRRINMLGEKGAATPPLAGVTQAGWIRALMSTFLGTGAGRAQKGLFTAATSADDVSVVG